ncbi:AAA family ATPase [Morganella morganii]|uniref:AAA family ATPase n=1 Tax=Morganella morganii TaxID=582 RepID=UPI0003DBCFEF|nr:AAA family ATPase [Morganella morganii]EJG2203477.1 ATP-binding protein [Morganella morganii]ELN8407872.1 ATP-binding protein [Morganella morganii]MDS0908928.1 AAA family ATPase [Morganella morganii]OPL23132.1 ABC transporter ATP-binding protein [Morganella morganii]RTY19866.1 ATP-binding protein [Morganella morganii subsp. morganii]
MQLTLAPNPLHDQPQTLHINKVATLIGENGSGKSTILQSIFSEGLNGGDHAHLRTVCFSSGQNESFSKHFNEHVKKIRRRGKSMVLSSFYYDKTWSKLLVFLATALVRDGKTRTFLLEKGYAKESQDINRDDISSKLSFSFRVDKRYAQRVQDALKKEEVGVKGTLRQTPFYRSLESFVEELIDREYLFEEKLSTKKIELSSYELLSVKFARINPDEDLDEVDFGDDPSISFLTQAVNGNFINKRSFKLMLLGNIELDDLSDGEYQLLFLYALIDLFDAPNTLFLFDEADSHLHYKNVEKLWSLLHSIQGHAITTTHLLDSISAKENSIEHLKVVEHGRINEDNKIKQLISRLSVLSRAKSVEFEVCGKLPNIALLDDYNDWIIFTKLASRAGLDLNRLATVHAMKKSSSYATANETFGKGKIDWLHGLSKIESPLVTTKIFLICDRDEAALDWNAANGVQVNGQVYRDLLNAIQWPRDTRVSPYLLAWKRREIKNYLLSYTALAHHNLLGQINNGDIAQRNYLQSNNPGDNNDIRRMNVKDIINPLINTVGEGLDPAKLQAYIDLIPPAEISEDITNMYNFIIGKL